MKPELENLLKKHGYHIAGRHSAVKTCHWSNRAIRGAGSCYKSQFYGVRSHRCIQMTPTLSCNHRCLHCWRPVEMPVPLPAPTDWDSPVEIKGSIIREHARLISGYGGSETTDMDALREAQKPDQVAISLAGEPTLYPYLPELIDLFHKDAMTTFVVSNGTQPDMIAKIAPTQLYLSLNAPDEDTYLKVCNPCGNFWAEIQESLQVLGRSKMRTRTAVRITLIKGVNMFDPEGYARLLSMCEPDYIEVKAYMHVGFSQKRLNRAAMPDHEEVRLFASEIGDAVGYRIADDSKISRVVLLSRDGGVEQIQGRG
uniref:S-adenosyl-L-methionine-dependent tRNA 4-demethylwyosine synthase n=1 Tax=Candidatus Methanogaster sp. ANME-2c ERB4 TaxID=2759911 RepID=A0A7G9YPH7_9EURY|nr:S-adenosyl-L-methionine-dependent tRNA 4-demethylwyosine synthase [Methanosarcinales archaeon ANME-2c ERB4]